MAAAVGLVSETDSALAVLAVAGEVEIFELGDIYLVQLREADMLLMQLVADDLFAVQAEEKDVVVKQTKADDLFAVQLEEEDIHLP